jgi:ParB/RepB/Spo0J family partition protein
MNIVVRPKGAQFELMAGERRWRAFQLNRARVAPDRRAEWETIRADVREASDVDAADIVAVENLQREQLSDLDEAFTYAQLMDLHQFTQVKQLADHLKRPVRTIQRLLQIHRAPDFIKDAMMKGILVEVGQGEAAKKTHRRLDKEPALAFLRLYEVFGRQRDPGLQREPDDAREALAQARAAAAEAGERRSEGVRASGSKRRTRLPIGRPEKPFARRCAERRRASPPRSSAP